MLFHLMFVDLDNLPIMFPKPFITTSVLVCKIDGKVVKKLIVLYQVPKTNAYFGTLDMGSWSRDFNS